jgi:HSP20 family protein
MAFNLPSFRNRSTDITTSRDNIENIFEEFFNDFGKISFPSLSSGKIVNLLPRLNISETDDKYYIEAELPGVKQSDVDVKLDNNILTIKGKTEENTEKKERNYFMQERYYGSFQRSLTLPNNANNNEINATFKDGILNIEITKKPEGSSKRIEVK